MYKNTNPIIPTCCEKAGKMLFENQNNQKNIIKKEYLE